MRVILTPSAEHLDLEARTLATHPNNENRLFPDDEVYVQLADIEDLERAVVVHAGQPHPNRGLAFLDGVLALLAEHDVRVTLVFSYVPYGRQDKAFFDGTLNYVRAMVRKYVDCYGVERIFAVDPHFSHRAWVEAFPLETIGAFSRIDEQVAMDEYVVVGPDLGAVQRFGVPGYEKDRESAFDVELRGTLDVAGRNVLVFDDLIATGGTMVSAYDRLKAQGANRIQAAAVHGVIESGIERVQETYDDLYLTNTIDTDAATVRVEPLLRDVLDTADRK